ncbi:thiamine pyrophosphate-dependent dehydrogenase E1 component subunit alpha [Texas Phoenix palm phytoplasma]|uniref:thiamine pyrophosphate-dependent dehydrogenase E1 component subunit alpha n=1 Tax=Texas Phoenix palm phytoplasma TaxID=176709 RepID=UPI001FF074E4
MKVIDLSVYEPLKKKRFQILDLEGNIIDGQKEPNISDEKLLKMYKTMILARVSDVKALQYQRQGKMSAYILNKGHEAAQIGSAAAMDKNDWFSPYFRDIGFFLYRDPNFLEDAYLYWYGNEKGSKRAIDLKCLPVNIIIGSGITIAAGLAMASKLQNKKEITVATIGDGGTAHDEFYSGLNFASVFKSPLLVIIMNNQYAISTPRRIASNTYTLAEKCYAFGIPGIQVDGNDVLAVYTAVKQFSEDVRQGQGPGLIELVTYRMGAHTTNDNPSLYRSKEEELEWEAKDPIIRFQKYLLNKNILTKELIENIQKETEQFVSQIHSKIISYGNKVKPIEIFQHMYHEMTPQLKEQLKEHESFLDSLEKEGK